MSLFDPSSLVGLALGWGLLFALSSAVFVAIGFAWEKSRPGRARKIFALPLAKGQLSRELLANVGFVVLVAAVFSACVAAGIIRADAGGAGAAILTSGSCLVGFEVYYYAQHRALHTRRLIRFHRWHHASKVTTPLSGQSLGLVEALGWVGGLALC